MLVLVSYCSECAPLGLRAWARELRELLKDVRRLLRLQSLRTAEGRRSAPCGTSSFTARYSLELVEIGELVEMGESGLR